MKVQALILHPYNTFMLKSQKRSGVIIEIRDEKGNQGWGEIAPLPKWSLESLEEALQQLFKHQQVIFDEKWKKHLAGLNLYPSVEFGIESALLALHDPLPPLGYKAKVSALLMGTPNEILEQAKQRKNEGFFSAKLKVSQLSFGEAEDVIKQLQNDFLLRIDVNRAWPTEQSVQFFSKFRKDAFDYVEEPFQNPKDLGTFSHPFAVDESFPSDLSFEELTKMPMLKAIVYKPTIQGGISNCIKLQHWTAAKGISLVLSSCFESHVGLSNICYMAQRLGIQTPLGIGTYHHMSANLCMNFQPRYF